MFNQEIKQSIYEAQHGYCKYLGCHNKIHSIHHMLHDTAYNRKKFSLFINSPMNGIGLCDLHHRNNQHEFKITDMEAKVYEDYLRKLTERS